MLFREWYRNRALGPNDVDNKATATAYLGRAEDGWRAVCWSGGREREGGRGECS